MNSSSNGTANVGIFAETAMISKKLIIFGYLGMYLRLDSQK